MIEIIAGMCVFKIHRYVFTRSVWYLGIVSNVYKLLFETLLFSNFLWLVLNDFNTLKVKVNNSTS